MITLAAATAARQLAEAVYNADKTEANLKAYTAACVTETDAVVAGIDSRGNTTQPATQAAEKVPFVKFLRRESYGMRGTATRKSDIVTSHVLEIGGTKFDFSKIVWADGSVTIRAYQYNTTIVIHEFHSAA